MTSQLSDFQIIKKLGDGAYSSVYKVRRQEDNEVYALKKVKMLNLTDKEKENALNEVRILASINHNGVIAYKEAFIDDPSSSLCLVMEYADNGDVFQKICSYQKRETYIKEKKIWYIFIQVVRGLKALHDRKILHRDMKSANIFLYKDMQAKLGDLNVSKIVKKGLSYTQTGTPYYASPEVWRDMPYDSKSDIWSLGCVLYEMCALVPPFRADDMQGLYKKVIKGKYPRIPEHFSQEMATVIKFMLQVSPTYRPSCDQILALPIIESLIKKFFPDDPIAANLVAEEENKQTMLQTIRLSKNMFSLTERLPKAKYRSPNQLKFNSLDGGGNEASVSSLLPALTNQNGKGSRNAGNAQTIQPQMAGSAGSNVIGGVQDETKPIIKSVKSKAPAKSKSRLQEMMDQQAQDGKIDGSGGYDEEDLESGDGMPQIKRMNRQRKRNKQDKQNVSDLEGTGDQQQIMRIASQGGPINNNSEKDINGQKYTRSEQRVDVNSVEGERSLDPDHEPRKEGSGIKQMKQSPSVIEIGGLNDQSDGQSFGGDDRSFRRGSQGRSPANVGRIGIGPNHNQATDHSDDDYSVRGLNRENKHTRSQKKIKPMYPQQMNQQHSPSKQMLKVVQEENNLNNNYNMPILAASNQQSPQGYQYSQIHGMQPRGAKMSSRERGTKVLMQGQNSKLQNVYSQNIKRGGVAQNRIEARQYLNRNGSEEKLKNSASVGLAGQAGMNLYQANRKPGIEQRYKSHLRGQDAPGQVGLVRNPSKPALQLPEIKNQFGKQNMQQIQNDMSQKNFIGEQLSQHSQILNNQRSKKNLHGHAASYGGHGGHQQQIQQLQQPNYAIGGYNITPVAPDGAQNKKYQYQDMFDKSSMKGGNDLTKIYMVNSPGAGAMAGPGIASPTGNMVDQAQYQRRLQNNQSPSQADLKSLPHPNGIVGGGINHGGNHFHNRNQSMDVINSNKLKNKLQVN